MKLNGLNLKMLSKETFNKLRNYESKFNRKEIDFSDLEKKLEIEVELIVIKDTEKNYHFEIKTSPEHYNPKHL